MRIAIAAAAVLLACAIQGASAAPLTGEELAVSHPMCARLDSDVEAHADADRVSAARMSCQLPTSDVTAPMAASALADRDLTLEREGDQVTIYARVHGDAAMLCCSLQMQMHRIGETDFWVARFHLDDLDHAMLTFAPPAAWLTGRVIPLDSMLYWRGAGAPPAPSRTQALHGRMIATTLHSAALHETRRINIYLPPNYVRGRNYPAIFMADGEGVDGYAALAEELVRQHRMRPVVIVGAVSGQSGIVEDRAALHIDDLRHADYLPNYPGAGDRFERHLRFFCRELTAFAGRTYGVSSSRRDRAVTGASDGGVFALEAGLRCGAQFATAWPMSGGLSGDLLRTLPSTQTRFLISAGLYEPGFYVAMNRAAAALRAAGRNVEIHNYAAGHMLDQWQLAFVEDAARTFPP